ncbi:MAG: HD domain-containing protein [Chloroflexi bacterium]|nr:HD domain-containing protein [Chloroflexota bacterium]
MPPLTHHEPRVFRNRGVEIALAPHYEELEKQTLAAVEPLWKKFPKAARVWELITRDPEVRANWDMADYLTVTKLNYNDHGEAHARLVAANSVLIYHLLLEARVMPDVARSGAGDEDDACAVVVAACLLHDIGNQVHRQQHELIGVMLARPILDRLLPEVYPDIERRIELRAFILHAIHAHDLSHMPLTFEAALVALADGTDITKGRGRTAFDLGKVDIHSVSALAIDEVRIAKGERHPVEITVVMNNSAGIFQIEDTLTRRLKNSPLASHVNIIALTHPEDSKSDMRIIERLSLQNGTFKTE